MKRVAKHLNGNGGMVLTTAGVFVFLAATPLIAQRPQADSSMDLGQREMILRNIGKEAPPPSSERELKLLFERVSNNFKRIQILDNELRRTVLASNTFDYQRIITAVEEIEKRAKDLRLYLRLPAPNNKPTGQQPRQLESLNDQQLKALLMKLDRTINSFVTNPVFQNPLLNNVQQSNKASNDLALIIDLSGSIGQTAKRLRKTNSSRQ